jgi:presenilin-like A22 family membrane protease
MKHPFAIVLIILTVWLAAQSIGLIVVEHYGVSDLPSGVERPDAEAGTTLWMILFGITIGTALILVLARFKQRRLWAVWFSLAVFLLSYVALSAFVPLAAALVIAALFVYLKLDTRLHWIARNLPELFLYAGIAAVFVPLLTVPIALVLLLAISAYDAIAVWRSKHMITLARFQIESGHFAGFSMPRSPFITREAKPNRRVTKPAKDTGGSAILGGGDFAFPLLYSGTILLSFGWIPALGAVIGGYFGLLGLFTLSHENRFYPAMPFLTAGLVLGSMIGILI